MIKRSYMAKLFMLLIGCKPQGRHTEQHDVFFGIAESIRDLLPAIKEFWPEAGKTLHLDAWREVTNVDGCEIRVVQKPAESTPLKLFFINLGGYKKNEFEEFHYKMLIAAADKGEAVTKSKKAAFFRHTGFKGANAHIDDRYGIDVDDFFEIPDILPAGTKGNYVIQVTSAETDAAEDIIHLGYFKPDKVDKWDTTRSDADSQKSSPE
jgi:hypothetical protein